VLEILSTSTIIGTRRKVENLTDAKKGFSNRNKMKPSSDETNKRREDVGKERGLLEIHGS
jgi:hypothetical protein